MNKLELIRLKKVSNLLNDKDIRRIVEKELDGYFMLKLNKNSDFVFYSSDDEIENKVLLFRRGNIVIVYNHNNITEITTIKSGPNIEKYTYEFRENGVILEQTNTKYDYSAYSSKYKVPTVLIAKRYSLNRDDAPNFKGYNLSYTYSKHDKFIETKKDKLTKNPYTVFESYMVNQDLIPNFKGPVEELYATHVFVNDRDLSHAYQLVVGENKLSRIYNMCKGVINEENIDDMRNIHLGLTSQEAYDYYSLRGYTKNENSIAGERKPSDDRLKKVSKLLSSVTFYDKQLESLDRDEVLAAIKYYPTPKEMAFSSMKKNIEKTIGISYEEFSKLDIEEQEKLIEKKTGKKISCPTNSYIDGYPVSSNDINEEIDRIIGKENGVFKKMKKKTTKK